MKDAMWEQYCGNEVDVCNSHHSSLHLIGDSVLAQDQAGEFGARRIYKGQMDVFGRHTALGKLIEVRTVFCARLDDIVGSFQLCAGYGMTSCIILFSDSTWTSRRQNINRHLTGLSANIAFALRRCNQYGNSLDMLWVRRIQRILRPQKRKEERNRSERYAWIDMIPQLCLTRIWNSNSQAMLLLYWERKLQWLVQCVDAMTWLFKTAVLTVFRFKVAVETEIGHHYNDQLRELSEAGIDDPQLREVWKLWTNSLWRRVVLTTYWWLL